MSYSTDFDGSVSITPPMSTQPGQDPRFETIRTMLSERYNGVMDPISDEAVQAVLDGLDAEAAVQAEPIPVPQTAPRITICQLCHRRLHQQRNGAWYHSHNASVSCRPGEGSARRAVPLEIAKEADR